MLKFEKKLAEFDIKDLNDDNLDPAFVAKATDLLDKIKKGTLKDEEIAEADNELCNLFDELHDFEEVDDPKMTELQRANAVLQGKEAVNAAGSIDELQKVIAEYKDFMEVMDLAHVKIGSIQQKIDQENAKAETVNKIKLAVDSATSLDQLKEITKDFDDQNPQVVEIVNAKIAELKESAKQTEQNKNSEIQNKLLSKDSWTYGELRELGISPTGENMIVHGIKLDKVHLFKVYAVTGKIG